MLKFPTEDTPPPATGSSDAPAPESTPVWPDVDDLPGGTKLYPMRPAGLYSSLKPVFDTILAAILAFPAIPLMLLAWLAIKLTSPGPGFYFQTRSGLNGRAYRIIKIRTMRHDRDTAANINWAAKGDTRITVVGRVLRALHLDELPQLLNVLRGEMSLIGPRPERPEVIRDKNLLAEVPGYNWRLSLHQGVTGLAQVQLPADEGIRSVRHKVCYDLYYLAHQSLWLDIRIALATVLKMAFGPEALRKILFLPTREKVCGQFQTFLNPEFAGANSEPFSKSWLGAKPLPESPGGAP